MNFFKNKNIFITGHTGFKGAWLSRILTNFGAQVTGYALEPPTQPNLFELINLKNDVNSINGDIRDLNSLKNVLDDIKPEIVIHMAAQPLVLESYDNPVYTYETNVMGTVNILECIRDLDEVKSFLNVTTDKVYKNKEWVWPYRENEYICGRDPYSNSKSCSELVTYSYKNSFFLEDGPGISTARSGNVIGGGDFAKDRIIPDCVRAAEKKEVILVRNPHSIRPYQHVLECLSGYLLLVKKQYIDKNFAGSYNFGPDESSCVNTGKLVDIFCKKWKDNQLWVSSNNQGPHEANYLKLDCSKSKTVLGWNNKWDLNKTMEKLVEWSKCYLNNEDAVKCLDNQINEYFEDKL